MTKQEIIEKFKNSKLTQEQLNELILYFEASEAYYGGIEDPIMSDTEFDELTEKLIGYMIPEIATLIQASIFRMSSGLEEVTEYTQEMISLDKIKYKDRSSVAEIKKFFPVQFQSILKRAPKLDGAALKITWDFTDQENLEIKQILTRGGLDCTHLFKNHPDILRTKKYRKKIIAGELVIAKKMFLEKYSSEVGGDYENARNFVGSLVKQKEISKEVLDDLNFIECTDGINALPIPLWKDCPSAELYNLENIIKFFKSEEFPYLCDGIVLAYHEEGERKVKDNYPLNMVAVKFPASRAKSKVIGFTWTQKKSGNLTPKVMIVPTKLDGSTCTCANGYNYQNLLDKHIGIGSEIEFEKSGDIIPVVAKVLTFSNNITFPDCEYRREGKHLKAMDMEESRRYKFILGLRILQLDGIGETLAEKIGDVVDFQIFELFNQRFKPGICNILGGGANWQKFSKIYDTKTLYLDTIIAMMQFNRVGPIIAKKVALLITKKSTDNANVPSEVLRDVCAGEGFKRINEAIQYLKIHGIRVLAPLEVNEDTITFEMSQEQAEMTKDQFKEKLKLIYPNALHTTLTRQTKYLFVVDPTKNGGKLNKARKYNTKIVTYKDALAGKL